MRIGAGMLAWAAVTTTFALCLCGGRAYGRVSDWTSAEWVYTPPEETAPTPAYSSDYLIKGGQTILLKDWQSTENEREISIALKRPIQETPVEEPESTEIPEALAQEGETTDPDLQKPEPDENPYADEVTVLPDATAAMHLAVETRVTEDTLVLILSRAENPPGLTKATPMTLSVAWYGLEATLQVALQPYGDLPTEETTDSSQEEREIVSGLTATDIHDTIDPADSLAHLWLNPQTQSDFTVALLLDGEALHKVRWSLDGGETYSLLYDSHTFSVAWPYPEGWDGTVVLDFTHALAAGQQPTVAVEATGYGRKEFIPALNAAPELPQTYVLTGGLPDTAAMPVRWGTARIEARSIQRLTKNEQEEYVYVDEAAITATTTDAGIRLEAADGVTPSSGSYRMTLHWMWNGISLRKQTVYFFINTQ